MARVNIVIKAQFSNANFWANIMVSPLRNSFQKFWWRYMLGPTVTMPWPRGPVEVGPNSRLFDGFKNEIPQTVESADPNDHYRPWLEKNIGRQGWDWDWDWRHGDGQSKYLANTKGDPTDSTDTVIVRTRRKHRSQLAEFKLLFG